MESRRIIYYSGNTITRSYSEQSVKKRLKWGRGYHQPQRYIIPKIRKVFATKNCMWCPKDFDDFRVVCDDCRNCQYCGLQVNDPNVCDNCDNVAPPELWIDRTANVIKVI